MLIAVHIGVRIWLAFALLLPVFAWGQGADSDEPVYVQETAVPADPPADDAIGEEITWVDTAHSATADSAQALVEWMDEFFGDPTYDAEKAESFLRLEFENEWDEEKGNDFGVRLRGKVQLPKISQRVDLLFSDDDTASADREERADADQISLQVNVRETQRSRFDATLGWSSGAPKPGVRYRNEGEINEKQSYRYVQRLQWAKDDGLFTLGQVDLFHQLDSDDVMRWSNRIKWGEETDGVEWRTRLSLFQRFKEETSRPLAFNHFLTIRGETEPKSYVQNYALGTVFRRKVYRDFLFFEVEPSANFRKPNPFEDRDLVWQIVLRLEIHLARDLAKRQQEIEEERETRRARRREANTMDSAEDN